ncbi:nitroreductase [Halobacillus fulvus]|nr:nitroreductase [Halobacillus fulvus]
MNVMEAMKNRRSIHEFEQENVQREVLQDIFSTASWAPTHRMKEPWMIKVYEGAGREQYIAKVLESYEREGFFKGYGSEKTNRMQEGIRSFLKTIPHHALIYMEKDESVLKYEEDYAAVCAFIQNAQLAGWEKGVGMLWMTSPYIHDPEFVEAIGLSDRYKVVGVLQMGYPKKVPAPKPRTHISQKLTFIDSSIKESFR